MGYVRVKAKIWNVERPEDVKEAIMLVNTDAIYTMLPKSSFHELGVPNYILLQKANGINMKSYSSIFQ